MTSKQAKESNSILSQFLRLKLNIQMLVLMAIIVTSFIVAEVVGRKALNNVMVNGPVYAKIVSNKDLVADILPPPAYLLESWQVALEMTSIKNQPLQPLIEKSDKLAQEFATRAKYWDETITDPKMHDVIKKQLQPSGESFIRVRDNIFIPAIRSGEGV